LELTAQAVVDYARANGIQLTRMGTSGEYPNLCATWTITHSITPFNNDNRREILKFVYNDKFIAECFNIEIIDVHMIEAGFEGWADDVDLENPYYKLGQEIYRLSREDQ
jgi:hypothetical protein